MVTGLRLADGRPQPPAESRSSSQTAGGVQVAGGWVHACMHFLLSFFSFLFFVCACVCVRACVRACVCVCNICVYVSMQHAFIFACMHTCVCVCVCERERERERERESKSKKTL